MATDELLSQDEIDALLYGVDDGEIVTASDASRADGEIYIYDFESEDRLLRTKLLALENINQRFARQFRGKMFNILHNDVEVIPAGVQFVKYEEYLNTLLVPISMNLVKINTLRGTAMFVFDPNLVFAAVDTFFGGDGRYPARMEGREFTATELRIVEKICQLAFEDMSEAWKPVYEIAFEYSASEVNPQLANVLNPASIVVVNRFSIDIEGRGGELNFVLPYTMIEPIRGLLDSGKRGNQDDRDERFARTLRHDLGGAQVEVASTLTETQITVAELMNLKAGDVIPIDMPEQVVVNAEGTPILVGTLGMSQGAAAIRVTDWIHSNVPDEKALVGVLK